MASTQQTECGVEEPKYGVHQPKEDTLVDSFSQCRPIFETPPSNLVRLHLSLSYESALIFVMTY